MVSRHAITIASVLLLSSQVIAEGHAQRGDLAIPIAPNGDERAITAEALLTLREIGGMVGSGLSVSPDGRHIAFELHQADIEANDYRVAWFIASISGGNVRNVGDGGDATLYQARFPDGRRIGTWMPEYAKWAPDSSGIAYRRRVNGEIQVWWSPSDGRAQKQLTHSPADVQDFYWAREGERLFFVTDADRADLEAEKAHRYRRGDVFDYDKGWSTIDGHSLAPPYVLTGGEPRVWVLDLTDQQERLVSVEERSEYEVLERSKDYLDLYPNARRAARSGREAVAWVQADDPEKQGKFPPLTVYASRRSSREDAVRCPMDECTGVLDLDKPLRNGIDWVGDEVVFARKEGIGYSKRALYAWRPRDGRIRRILSTDEWLSDCSIVGTQAVCFRETATYPRTIVAIDIANGATTTLVDPNPEFAAMRLGEVSLVGWKNRHGVETFGYLVKPPGYTRARRYPLVLVGYRARWALRGGVGEEYPVHLLAANGMVVLVYEKPIAYAALEVLSDPLDIARMNFGPELFDVRMPLSSFESIIELLHADGIVDKQRVGVTGFSNGTGHLNYALIHSNLFAAAISSSMDFSPATRILSWSSNPLLRDHRKVIGAAEYPGPDGFLFSRLSLGLNADYVKTPLLVNVSDSEHPWALAELIGLLERDRSVEMVVYPDEGHVKWQPAHRLSVYERNVDWLNFWLQDRVDPDPGKVEQYRRWRQFRRQTSSARPADQAEETFPVGD